MDIKQLEIFVTACERGSFSQAAACMYMTQPNISKSIRALEHELGRPLLIRNAKGVQPTAYGKTVLEHAQMILKTAATISALAIPDEQDNLSLSAYPSNMVARLLVDFYQTWGSTIHIEHHEGTVEEITDHVHQGISEVGIVYVAKNRLARSSIFSPIRNWNLFPRVKRVYASMWDLTIRSTTRTAWIFQICLT